MTELPDVVFRHLRFDDLDQVLALERTLFGLGAWTEGMFREEIDGWGRWYLVAEDRAATPPKIVGYAGLWFDGEISQVMTMAVAPAAQRRGIGTELLAAIVEHSRELGADSIFLEVRVDNGTAIRLYENFGFEPLGLRRRYYQPEDVDALTMRLGLA